MSINGFPKEEFLIENEGLGLYLTLDRGSGGQPSFRLAEDSGEPSQYWCIDSDRHLVNLEEFDGRRWALNRGLGTGGMLKHPELGAPPVTICPIEDGTRTTEWWAEGGYIFPVGEFDLVLTPNPKQLVLTERNQPNQRWTIHSVA